MPSRRTNLGPLTTRFAYPDRCTAPVIGCSTCDVAWQAQTCGDNPSNSQGVQDDPDCWPPRSKADMDGGYALNGWGFYSPGLECPDGYEPACSATGTATGDFNFQFSINDDETVIGCCPTGYSCDQPGGPQTCKTVASRGSMQAAMCNDGETQLDWYTLPVTYTQTGSDSEQATLDYITIMAPMFQLNRKASDLASVTMTSSDVTTSSDTTTVETGSAATSQSSNDSASTSGGLSTGAQAGIGAGVGVVGLAIIGVALYLWRRKRNAAPAGELPADEPKPPGELVGSTQHSPQPYQYHPVELDASHAQRSEMQ